MDYKNNTLQKFDADRVARIARVQVANLADNDWLMPLSLLNGSEPSQYPLNALPTGLQDAVREVLDFVQCPIALAACSALSALSVSAQHLADVRRAEGLTGPVSLYILAIADSGERKSSVDKHFTKAITEWEANQAEFANAEVKRQRVDHEAWQMQIDGLKQKIRELSKTQKPTDVLTRSLHQLADTEPLPVRVPRLIYGDSTPEQLGFSLAKNWPSGAVLSSEAGIIFGSHGMSGDSAMRNLALLNVLWDGSSHIVDRRASESYKVQDVRLTMGMAVQVDTVRAFFDNSKGLARGTGFLARFLVAWPESRQGDRPFKESPSAWPKLTQFSKRLTELLNDKPLLTDTGGISPTTLDFSNDAKAAWVDFYNQVELELRLGGEMVEARDVASKAADNVARLAALFHLYQWGSQGQIEVESVTSATVIITWHLFESKRFLNQIAVPMHVRNALKVDAYLLRYSSENNTDRVPKNWLRQKGPLRDKKLLDESLDELVDANRIRIILDNRTSIVEINPKLLGIKHA